MSAAPANDWQALPALAGLKDGGIGQRFELADHAQANSTLPAFAVKYEGQVYAYLNQCAHVDMEMDWQPAQFFDADQRYIMCATHGSLYEPATGKCIDGPCIGKSLKPVALRLDNGMYYAPQRF